MGKERRCLYVGQWIFIILGVVLGCTAKAAAPLCQSVFAERTTSTYSEEVRKQWGYLDQLKADRDKTLKKKSRRLMREIENHLYENNVAFEIDPESSAILIKVLSKEELKQAHPLNRFATSLFYKHRELRVEIDPLKLKLDQAGALFDEQNHRLTLALDNVIDLKTDSFVGHELKHAYFWLLEEKGIEHPFMGWLKRKEGAPILQKTYPDAFSLDELPAYYYQLITLARESLRDPSSLETAKDFTQYALELLQYIGPKNSPEVAQFAMTYLKQNTSAISISHEDRYDIVKIDLKNSVLELNFLKKVGRTDQELRESALLRLQDLNLRAAAMQSQLIKVQELLSLPEPNLHQVLDLLSAGREVIDVKKLFHTVAQDF